MSQPEHSVLLGWGGELPPPTQQSVSCDIKTTSLMTGMLAAVVGKFIYFIPWKPTVKRH